MSKWRVREKGKFLVFPSYDAFSPQEGTGTIVVRSGGGTLEASQIMTPKKRLIMLLVAAGVCLGLLSWLFVLQVVRHGMFLEEAERNRNHFLVYRPPRGVIVDRNGNLLADNIPQYRLLLDTSRIALGTVEEYLANSSFPNPIVLDPESERERQEEFMVMASDTRHEVGLAYREFASTHSEFTLEIVPQRRYPYGASLSHVVGYVGKLSAEEWERERTERSFVDLSGVVGKAGIERQYEDTLRGTEEVKSFEINAFGDAVRLIGESPSASVAKLNLSIDADLQKAVFGELERAVQEYRGSGGVVGIADASNGEVLALASTPSFDNNVFIGGTGDDVRGLLQHSRQPLFFRAVSGEYPSGSLIKPIVALAALQEGVITPATTINSTGGIAVGNFFFPDWKAGGHGRVSVTRALAESVNTFFYYLGGGYEEFEGLGVEQLNYYADMFGLGKPTGIGIGSEGSGFLPSPKWKLSIKKEPWYIGDTYHMAIGQGDLLVTPVQMLQMASVLSQKGTLRPLHVTRGASEPVTIPIDQAFWNVVDSGLRETVTSGSAQSLSGTSIRSAGKTGTAEVGNQKAPHAWFIGYTPVDQPRYAFVVLVENGGEGSTAAVPVARSILRELVERGYVKP